MEGVTDKDQRLSEGRVEAEDDAEVELLLPRKGADEQGQISAMCRKRRVLSRRTGIIWSLCLGPAEMEPGRTTSSGA